MHAHTHTVCNHDIHTLHLHGLLMIMCDNAFRVFELEQWGCNQLCVCFCLCHISNKNETIYMHKHSKKNHKLKKKTETNDDCNSVIPTAFADLANASRIRHAVNGFSKTQRRFHFELKYLFVRIQRLIEADRKRQRAERKVAIISTQSISTRHTRRYLLVCVYKIQIINY